MENNIKKNQVRTNLLCKMAFSIAIVAMVFLGLQGKITSSMVMAADTNEGKCYLSDIPYMETSHAASGHIIKTDRNDSDKLITLKHI